MKTFLLFLAFPMVLCVLVPTITLAGSTNHTDSSRIYKMPNGDTLKQYFLVMLKKGPKRASITDTAAINRIQAGHLANIGRLAKEGKLVMAGPFGDDGDWRGIFIFDCNTQKEVEDLLASDPAIISGRLAYEIHPWWAQKGTVLK